MCRFVESIQLKDGQFKRLELHQARLEKAFAEFYPNLPIVDLAKILNQSSFPSEGLFKSRILFDSEIRQIEFIPYIPHKISSLKLVETKIQCRTYKLEDRTEFNNAFAQRDNCDDVLLVKNGLLTDTSYCNIALYNGTDWVTPHIPLLYGVNRSQLLAEGKLRTKDIAINELKQYLTICLFNAMNEFGEISFPISDIYG